MKGRGRGSFCVGEKTVLTKEDVLHVAKLARFKLTEEEVVKFQDQLSGVLSYVGRLQAVDTNGVSETSQVTGLENVSREDEVESRRCLLPSEVVSNAPQSEGSYIQVKAVIKAK